MARVTTVNKSMKDQTCGRCGKPIPKGSTYRWAKPGFRSRTRLIRCTECPFRQSELTTSNLAGLYAAQEALYDAKDAWDEGAPTDTDDLVAAIDDAVSSAQEVADLYQEANDAWEQNSGSVNDEFTEKIEAIEAWIGELEAVEFEEPDTEDPDFDHDAWVEECREALDNAIESLEL